MRLERDVVEHAAFLAAGDEPVDGRDGPGRRAGTAALGGFSTRHMISLSTPLFSTRLLSVWLMRPVLAQQALNTPFSAAMGSMSMSSGR